jgi:Met-zincin/Domain of unknown function (DUF5117)
MSRMIGRVRFWIVIGSLTGVLCSAQAQQDTGSPPAGGAPSKFEQLTKGTKKVEGLWTAYFKDQQILVELKQSQLGQDFLMLSSIARGVSQGMVIGGIMWGDDVLWSFRKVGDKIHVLRRNVKFKAKPGSPEASAVRVAYNDSVMYALPILTDTAGGHLVDMTKIFLSDDEQVGRMLGAQFVSDRSTVGNIKAFKQNIEFDVNAVYSSQLESDTVPDSRGMPVTVHYSVSQLPNSGYRPRKADDRVGYFLTVTKDFTDNSDDQNFVRYINRWDLQKADPNAKVSPPKQPIVFHLEKTVPINLRPVIRAGIEEWNKAFEKLGFDNAVEVRQQREDDTWDPEDVNYNTFRWITAEVGFAMGPSRLNPLTGQILDADIIFDASFLRHWKQEYENFTPAAIARLMGGEAHATPADTLPLLAGNRGRHAECQLSHGMQHQMGFAAALFMAQGLTSKRGELPEEFLHQALKEVVMHEVGHTLGLRHNFKASAWKTLAEIEDAAKANEPTVGSVMDYSPVNINPAGSKQSAFYTTTIGPYDMWAIEYGYKVIGGDEGAELAKIASRSGESGLDYATDEDTESGDPDPLSNRFDLGKDPVAYAQRQMVVSTSLIPKILDRAVETGEGYQRARQAFGLLLGEYFRAAQFAARLPGGVYVNRDHKGENPGRPPFKTVEVAQQRAAMKLLTEMAFKSPTYDPLLLNSLAATRWRHWGVQEATRIDYPIHDTVSKMQAKILDPLLSSLTLARLQDGEVKVPANEDAYTLAEHLKLLTESTFSEVQNPPAGEFNNRNPYISSYRRNFQRVVLKRLSDLVLKNGGQPEDARVLLRMYLTDVGQKIDAALAKGDLKLDDYTRSHLTDTRVRIKQVLEAESEDLERPVGVRILSSSTRFRSDGDATKVPDESEQLAP